jgi:hypothetical protein
MPIGRWHRAHRATVQRWAPTSARPAMLSAVMISVRFGMVSSGARAGSGQINATVSARSPTKSHEQSNSSGSTRLIARSRTCAGLASANDNSPVSAANAQPRSGSGVVAKYSRIGRDLPLRDGVNSKASSSSANRFTAAHLPSNRRTAGACPGPLSQNVRPCAEIGRPFGKSAASRTGEGRPTLEGPLGGR